jgi:hypothetical protein
MLYRYVGPALILQRVQGSPPGKRIETASDLRDWLGDRARRTATFVVDQDHALVVADRRTEHVAAAGGRAVRAAGEIVFELRRRRVVAVEVTNQSTGYCPQPRSWDAVACALDRIGIQHPGHYTAEFEFRRCSGCGQINIVKDDDACGVCGAALPQQWNFAGDE